MNMGERLKELRIQKGCTQEEVGKLIGVSKATVMKYEKGIVENLKRSSIAILADFFNVTPTYLMCLSDDEKELVSEKDAKDFYFAYHKEIEGLTEEEVKDALKFYKEMRKKYTN